MSKKKITIFVDHELKGLRADVVVSKQVSSLSRSSILKSFQQHSILVNDLVCKSSYKCKEGDFLTFYLPKDQNNTTQIMPSSQELNIIFEDQWVLVVNKPAHLVVHPGAGHFQDTLVNALIGYTKDLSFFKSLENSLETKRVDQYRPGIVHRIDKDTSGLLVIAKNNLAHLELVKQFASRLVTRCYWALVFGVPQERSGQIKSRIARHPKDRKRFYSVPQKNIQKGKEAITHYNVVQSYNGVSLLHLTLGTGRTHQIRVHLAQQNHPILGDWVYGKKKRIHLLKPSQLQKSIRNLPRLALHASRLGFRHPYDHRYLEFEVGWPDDLLDILFVSGVESEGLFLD